MAADLKPRVSARAAKRDQAGVRRHRTKIQLFALLLAGCAAAAASAPPSSPIKGNQMFDEKAFANLQFLDGRWSGEGPDGKPFFELYDFPTPRTMRSRRYNSAAFDQSSDGSSVELKDGAIISTWGDFTWRATSISADEVQFEPVNAPSAFSWRKAGADEVAVTQRWTDEKGAPQTYTLTLTRVR